MTFKPKRWLDPLCKDVKEASQPFSIGDRACPGRKYVEELFLSPSRVYAVWGKLSPNLLTFHLNSFAFLEMSFCLAKLLFRYDMTLVNTDMDWEASSKAYIMWQKAPIMVMNL